MATKQGSHAYHDAGKCLQDNGNDTAAIGECFRAFQGGPYALCFNDTAIESFQDCMDASPGEADPWECGGVMMCAYETYLTESSAYIDSLGGFDACVKETVQDFVGCGMDNMDECHSPCHDAYSEDLSTLFPSITSSSVSACDAFQTDVADATCNPTSCCSVCLTQLDALLECVSNTVYKLGCDLTCSASTSTQGTRHRQLRMSFLENVQASRAGHKEAIGQRLNTLRFLAEEETLDAHVANECPNDLVNSTTLDALATTPALFMDCVALHYLWMFTDEGMAYVLGDGDDSVGGDDATDNGGGSETDNGEGDGTGNADGEEDTEDSESADAEGEATTDAEAEATSDAVLPLFGPLSAMVLIMISATGSL